MAPISASPTVYAAVAAAALF
eukprot:COSAG06_NODE_38519_length_422_cov_1.916409_1_plen_20_part_01